MSIEIESGICVVVQVHVHLVTHTSVDIEIDFLVEVHGSGLTIADGQRRIVYVLQRDSELELCGSLCLDAYTARTKDFLSRTEVEMHVSKVELFFTLTLHDFLVLRLEKFF